MKTETNEVLGDDLLWGYPSIAKELRKTTRQAVHLVETGMIPTGKIGNRVVASRKRLREFFAAATAGEVA
jgi:hypothetical protein